MHPHIRIGNVGICLTDDGIGVCVGRWQYEMTWSRYNTVTGVAAAVWSALEESVTQYLICV